MNQNWVLLDGHHRLKFCNELGIKLTDENIDIRKFDSKDAEIQYVVNANLERRHYNTWGRCLAGYNFKPYFEAQANKGGRGKKTSVGFPTEEYKRETRSKIADLIGVNAQTYWYAQQLIEKKYDEDRVQEIFHDNKIMELELDKERIENLTKYILDFQPKLHGLLDLLRNDKIGIERGYQRAQEWDELINIEIEKLTPKSDKQLLELYNIPIMAHDSWNYLTVDKRFGDEKEGRIAADLVFNALYFYTNQGDIIMDPMAGGGVVGDVCKAMNRKCEMYDVAPIREDIKKWDVLKKGFPKTKSKMTFWDPPYYKKKEQEYGEHSISSLDREQYLQVFIKAAKDLKQTTEILAFLMSPFDSEEEEDIIIYDYIKIFKDEGWKFVRDIHCDYSPNLIGAGFVKGMIQSRKMGRLARSLLLFRNGKG